MKVQLNSPINPNLNNLKLILEKIENNHWYTNFGPIQKEFTAKLEDYLGVGNLLLINNGTTALQIAGRTLGCHSYLTTPFSFVATSSAFLWQGDNLRFSDIDKQMLNFSPELAGEFVADYDAILATHVYGNPCDVKNIDTLAKLKNKKVIYDAAHAFGVKVNGNSVLNYGDASVLSFHATKVFHSIEGGAIVFKCEDDYLKAQELINFGINSSTGIKHIGINGKMSEYHAAVGLVNLEMADQILEHRSELFLYYRTLLSDLVQLPLWHCDSNYNGAYMPIILESHESLMQVQKSLLKHGVESRQYFYPSLDVAFNSPDICSISRDICNRILCLPLHYYMSKSDIDYIVSVLKKSIN